MVWEAPSWLAVSYHQTWRSAQAKSAFWGDPSSKMFAVFVFLGWWSANLDWELCDRLDLCDRKTCPSCLAIGMDLASHVGEWADPKPEICLCISFFFVKKKKKKNIYIYIYEKIYLAVPGCQALVVVHTILVVSGGIFHSRHGLGLCS